MSHLTFLYLHIVAAAILLGSTCAGRFARAGILAARELPTLRGALAVARHVTRANPALALAVLASGLLLAASGTWRAPWFGVAVGAWVLNVFLAARVLAPAGQRLGAAAARAGDGPVPEAIDALRRARGPAVAADVMLGIDLGILLVMLAKPDFTAACAMPLAGAAIALALNLPRLVAGRPRTAPAQGGMS